MKIYARFLHYLPSLPKPCSRTLYSQSITDLSFASYIRAQNEKVEKGKAVGQMIDLRYGLVTGVSKDHAEKSQIDYFLDNEYYPLITVSTHEMCDRRGCLKIHGR